MDVHQYASFCNKPRLVHKCSVRLIANYPASTSTNVDLPYVNWRLTTRGVVYRTDIEKCIECYVDANFAGGWDQADADNVEKYHVAYLICNNVRGMSSIMIQ